MRRRPSLALSAAAAATTAVLTGGLLLSSHLATDADVVPSTALSSPSPSPSPSSSFLLRQCYVPSPEGNVSLTSEQAKALTTLAARTSGSQRAERRLSAAVDREATDATEAQRRVAVASLLGKRWTQRLTCGYSRGGVDAEKPGRSGLTPRARQLRAAWTDVFGPLIAGGFAAGGVSTGHLDGSAHYEGRALDVFFRPHSDESQRRAGRIFAQWLVAHAQDYAVLSVIYADEIWTSWAAYAGWRPYEHPNGGRNPVLRHLDHVHVAVESGEPFRGR